MADEATPAAETSAEEKPQEPAAQAAAKPPAEKPAEPPAEPAAEPAPEPRVSQEPEAAPAAPVAAPQTPSKEKQAAKPERQPSEQISTEGDTRREKLDQRAKEVVGEVIDVRRGSFEEGSGGVGKVARFLNTYKTDPDRPFNVEKVDKVMKEAMEACFRMFEKREIDSYDPVVCIEQAKWASKEIRAKVKELDFDRFKYVCLVTIAEKNNQDYCNSCRFLWDFERDNFAKYFIENNFVFGHAAIFAFYYE